MPKKVFELAKELNMGPLDLVEGLKAKGIAVRNHMSVLDESQIDLALKEFGGASTPVKKAAKKVVKKKTVKKVAKKTTKKPVAKKVAENKTEDSSEKVEKKITASKEKIEEAPKAPEKSTVIRRKVPGKTSSSQTLSDSLLGDKTLYEEDRPKLKGLTVVSRPELVEKVEEAPAVVEQKEEVSEKKETELYKEKVHRFTPVFIPEKKPKTEEGPEKGTNSYENKGMEESGPKDDSRKRMGGLASMVSGRKNAINRSQALQKSRADNELKSYATLSGIGRPIYTTVKKKRTFSGPMGATEITEVKESKRVIKLHGGARAVDLSRKLKVKLKDLVDKCLDLNLLVKESDYIGVKLAEKIAALYDFRVDDVSFSEEEVLGKASLSDSEREKLPLRNPIITIMGHVDHGKTTLLDYIRNAKVASGEAGGITQHIGAYSVDVKDKKLTFLDTPGHAAFGSMRQRGADVTDIVILVVAADDGVMPQTRESIQFIKNAGVPLIVAINKMDKEQANPDRIKQELTEFHITPEEWGGDTMMVPISALKGNGVDQLLESVALLAEMLDLRADPKGKSTGVVIEAKIGAGRGPMATVLVQSGTLKKGDSIVVGESYGRARSIMDHLGNQLNSAGPSMPVQILGINEAPNPGDMLDTVKNEREAKKVAANRVEERKALEQAPAKNKVSLEDFFASAVAQENEKKVLNLIVRVDVQGSFEAIKQSLNALSNSEVEVKILGGGVGPISDSDVQLAITANSFILGFNMRPITSARRMAEGHGVDIRTYSVIYELINDVKLAIEGLLDPEYVEKFIGRADVKDTFVVPKVGTIAGCMVSDGSIKVGCNIRLLRNGKIIHDGVLSSLKRFKDDVKEVKNGLECGMGLKDFNDVKVDDQFEAYILEEKRKKFEDIFEEEMAHSPGPAM